MKKFGLFAAIVAAFGLASCTNQAPKAVLNNEIDSLSYMMGISNTEGLEGYLTMRMGIDTTYMADFINGVKEGTGMSTAKEAAYLAGMQIGRQISNDIVEQINQSLFKNDSTMSLNKNNFIAGFLDALNQKNSMPTKKEAMEYVDTHVKAIEAKALEAKYSENKAAGEKFLAENATKEGVQTTPSGLQYKVIKQGKGTVPTTKNTVKVHYKGTLIDGTEFDSSYSRKEPASFPVTGVIRGWTEALVMMPVGSKWELYIPQELAYGSRNQADGKIKPFSALVFEVELLEIVK
ncbi:MAG: FKBP-type peptidyl-prolyl cis-trans isomerase [Bacteroidaceae bacterium]|nr:FKBP-type peptidyl-prolyl cis-trans isomerase [Bacteroidaceae bacterium]